MKVKRVLFFTDPYPDELITSAVSRYLASNPGLLQSQILYNLYGKESIRPNLLFGNNLNDLALRLGSEYDSEKLLLYHTVYPFFSPFISDSQKERVLDSALNNSQPINHLLGLSSYNYPDKPTRLRYCPVCKELDLQRYGETYFHTKHHLPGVDICPDHLVWLEDYPVEIWESFNPFIRADETVMTKTPRLCECEPEIRLAQSAQQVINDFSLALNSEIVLKKLKRTYQDRNLLSQTRTDFKGLYEMLLECYPQDYLNSKGMALTKDRLSRNHWLYSCSLERNRGNLVPYQCLLIINCFYNDYNEFLTVPAELRQDDGEWECLNPFCSGYHSSHYTQVTHRNNSKQSRAIVICQECRMIYTQNSQRKGKPSILQRGKLWHDNIRQLKDQGKTIKEISLVTGYSRQTVSRYLNERETNLVDKRIQQAREELIQFQKEEAGLTRKDLSRISSSTYKTLLDFDWEWFDRHLPKEKSKGNIKGTVFKNKQYYQDLDKHCVEELEGICQKLLDVKPPKQIYKKLLLSELGITDKNLKDLPETEKSINNKVEDKISYNIRKGIYYVDVLLDRGEPVTRNRLRNLGVFQIYNDEVSKAVFNYYKNKMDNYSF